MTLTGRIAERAPKKYKEDSFIPLLSDLVRSRSTPAGKARPPRPWTERSEGSGRERLNCIFPLLCARPQESEQRAKEKFALSLEH